MTTVHNPPTVARSFFSYDPHTGRERGNVPAAITTGGTVTAGDGQSVARKNTPRPPPEDEDLEVGSLTTSDDSSSLDGSLSSEEAYRRRKKAKKAKRRKMLGKDVSSGSKKSKKSSKSTKSKKSAKTSKSTKSGRSKKSKGKEVETGATPAAEEVNREGGMNCLLTAIAYDEDCELQLQPINEM